MPADTTDRALEPETRDVITAEIAALVGTMAERRDDWRTTILSIRSAILALDRVCEAASASVGDRPEPAVEVEAMVERLAGALRLQCDRTRAELEHARQENMQLEAELQAMRDRVRTLETEVANAQAIRSPEDAAASPSSGPSLQVISSNRENGAPADQRLVDYAAHLFEHIQAIYKADVEEMTDRSLIVERLAANLRHARGAFGRRLEACGSSDWSAFEQHLALLLDSETPQNSFGRHLAIAAYAYLAPVRAEAS